MAIINDLLEGDKDQVSASDDDFSPNDTADVYRDWLIADLDEDNTDDYMDDYINE
jgi:hypothetical protein